MGRWTPGCLNRGRFRIRRSGPAPFAGCLASAEAEQEGGGGPPGEEGLLERLAGGGVAWRPAPRPAPGPPQAAGSPQALREASEQAGLGASGRRCLCEEGLSKSPSLPQERATTAPWRVGRQVGVAHSPSLGLFIGPPASSGNWGVGGSNSLLFAEPGAVCSLFPLQGECWSPYTGIWA